MLIFAKNLMGDITMKKRLFINLILVFALTFTSVQAFAAETVKQIDVYVDGVPISFTVNPVLDGGSTLVEFKPVFEKIGLSVIWDGITKTVTGSSKDLNIKLIIGSKDVVVNGQKKQLTVAPKIINGVTMIPLRFIGEASGRDVSWDGRTKTVFIASTENQILYTIALNAAYKGKEDIEGVITTYDTESIDIEQTKTNFAQLFSSYDLKYEVEAMEMISLEKDKASAKITLATTRIAGESFADNKTDQIIYLNKINGEWKIETTQDIKIDYMKQDLLKEETVTLSDADQKLVLATIEKNRDAGEKEDEIAYRSTYDSTYPNLEQAIEQFKQTNASYKLKFTNTNVKFIKGSEDVAKVYYVTTIQKVEGPEFMDFKLESIDTLKKNKDGEWKIIQSDNLALEYLQ
jgi:hypothetical protein